MKNCQIDTSRPKTTRSHGRTVSAIRAAYETAHGTPVPSGARVVRTCATPDCYNPDHLTLKGNRSIPRSGNRTIRVWAYLSPEEHAHLTNNLTAPSVGGTIRKALGYDERETD